MLCDATYCCAHDRSCSIVKKFGSCQDWKKDGVSSNKESPQRRMRTKCYEMSMAVTKTSDILTTSNVCGLCYCRPASCWRRRVITTLSGLPFTRLVSSIQYWLTRTSKLGLNTFFLSMVNRDNCATMSDGIAALGGVKQCRWMTCHSDVTFG